MRRGNLRRSFCGALAVVCSLGLAASFSAEAAGAPPPGFASLPLWRAVPTKHFAILGEGRTADLRWGIYAYRGKGREAGRHPCIFEVDVSVDGPFSTGQECGPVSPPFDWPIFTSTTSTNRDAQGHEHNAFIIGMTLGLEVSKVVLDLGPGPNQTRVPRRLSDAQAKKARLRPFSYLALGIARDRKVNCLEGVTGFDAAGVEIIDTRPHYDCSGPFYFIPSRSM
jgi:hypothetical protein